MLLVVSLCGSLLQVGASTALAAPKQPRLPTTLTNRQVHPGSVLVAFRTPVRANGHHVSPDGSGSAAASSSELNQINSILDSLRAKQVQHLFTNIPAAALNAARAKAEAATGAYVTDLTQVYQVTFDPAINDGEAVNRLASLSLVSSAMPDWIFQVRPYEKGAAATSAAVQAVAAARAAGAKASLLTLPPNYGYISDGQSYQDAASNNVTGAWAMLADKFGKQPGEGETITNISLGTIDNTSTVLENGQRYLEQRGFPKIPVWLSSCSPSNPSSCDVVLDPTATNTPDGQGDLIEVLLDFSVMAPPPRGDPRVPNPQPPGQIGEILGTAYGANFRLINPLTNTTPNFFAAWLGGAFLQNPTPTVMTASIGFGFSIPGFSDYFFEDQAIIHDIVSTIANGAGIFVTISAGDGQTDTVAAMNPNGLTGPHEVTTDPSKVVDVDDPNIWGNPDYSYAVTFEPQFLIDSGANSAGGNALNDVFNNAPWNLGTDPQLRHDQHTTETRWTGQQNFHSGNGSRTNVAAPADDVLMLAQVENAQGIPVDPISTFPRLIGGTSASAPEIAAAAAVVHQASKLLLGSNHALTGRQIRDLLAATGRQNRIPTFDLDSNNVGRVLDLTRAVESLFASAHAQGSPALVRMTVADRKAVFWGDADTLRSSFWSDTPQDPTAHTATIDLSQGLISPSSRTNQTIGSTGDNINAPITFAVDGAYLLLDATFTWRLSSGGRTAVVPTEVYDARQPYLRLLPVEIFGLLGLPATAPNDRTVAVTASSGSKSITTQVTFKGQTNNTYTHAIPASFDPLFQPSGHDDHIIFAYDLRGVRDGHGGQVNGGVLIVSDIDRAVPQAFPDLDPDAHGLKKVLNGTVGVVTLSADDLPHGVGTYGVAVRGAKNGVEVADSTSVWLPLRYAPATEAHPITPKVLAEASAFGPADAPRFYDIADFELGGSSRFEVSYDVSAVPGAKGALIELSAPATDFVKSLFFVLIPIPLINNFTNPLGDRLDTGNNLGQPGSTFHTTVSGKSGLVIFDGQTIGLSVPAGACDSTYQVRVFATDSHGKIIGVASNPSVISYTDFNTACFS